MIHAGLESIIEDSQVWPEVDETRTLIFLSLSALFYGDCSVSTALKLLTHAERGKDQVKNLILALFPFFSFFWSQVDESASVSVFRRKKNLIRNFLLPMKKKSRFAFLDDPSSFAKKYRSASLSENQFSLFFVIVER